MPEALGNKIIHPFSDFLLHDIGTGDGILQGGPSDTRDKLRTSALWGLRMRPRFMHDLKSLSLADADNAAPAGHGVLLCSRLTTLRQWPTEHGS